MKKKIVSRKWLVIPLLFVLFVVLGNLSSGINLLDRAIVVGLAVDGGGEEIELSAQIIVPKNGGVSSQGNTFAVYESKGATLQEAIENLSTTIGLRASFAHTDVILFGSDFLRSGTADVLEYIFKSDLVRDSALLVAAACDAKDLFKLKLPVNEVVSYHLVEMLNSNRDEAGQNPMTLHKYFYNYYTLGGTNYMPLVNVLKEEKGSISPDSGKGEDTYRLELSKTVVLSREGYVMRLDREDSKGLSYADKRLNSGTLGYRDEDGVRREAVILDSKAMFEAVAEDEVKLSVVTMCRPAEKAYSEHGEQKGGLDGGAVGQIKGQIAASVEACFEHCRQKDCDIFALGEVLYRKYGEKFKVRCGEDYLDKVRLTVEVTVFTK